MIRNVLVGAGAFALGTLLFGPVVGLLVGLGAFVLSATAASPTVVHMSAPAPAPRFWHSWEFPPLTRIIRSRVPHDSHHASHPILLSTARGAHPGRPATPHMVRGTPPQQPRPSSSHRPGRR